MEYILIRAWAKYHDLEARFINDEIQKARDDKAPHNVTHKLDNGLWATIEDAGTARPHIEKIAGQLRLHENPRHPIDPPRRII